MGRPVFLFAEPRHARARPEHLMQKGAPLPGRDSLVATARRPRMTWVLASSLQLLTQPAGEVLDVLPGGAAGAGAARRRPFQRIAAQFLRRHLQPEMADIAVDH